MGRLKTLEKRAAWAFLGVAGEGVASQASGSWGDGMRKSPVTVWIGSFPRQVAVCRNLVPL